MKLPVSFSFALLLTLAVWVSGSASGAEPAAPPQASWWEVFLPTKTPESKATFTTTEGDQKETTPAMATECKATFTTDASETPCSGIVHADDFPDMQAAVDALGDRGGVVELGAKTYELPKTVLLKHRISFRGVMDAKAAFPVTKIVPAKGFSGEWLFQTEATLAKTNPDLNADIGFFNLVVAGTPQIGGLNAANVDVLRIERCRFAYMRRCIDVGQKTDLPRPWPFAIAPGGLFITNSIFQATDICINLEYATQNRIFSNWFVSNSGVVLRLLNTNKTWFIGNEVNQFTRAGILLEEDGGEGNHTHNNIISLNWIHSKNPDTKFVEVVNGDSMSNIVITNNILQGDAGVDLPPMAKNSFTGNVGNRVRTESAGRSVIPAGQTSILVTHRLVGEPNAVSLTPEGPVASYWITER
ncbi:MAG: right-handed parallel beta-helix repeat-containing protein, partial [Deltaproteobacteria bacterium]